MNSPQKARRVYSMIQKQQILKEHLEHGLSISAIRLRRENEALKKTIADLAVDNSILKEANEILKKKQPTPAFFRSPKK